MSQPNIVVESAVHPSLHQNCHHKIIYLPFFTLQSYILVALVHEQIANFKQINKYSQKS